MTSEPTEDDEAGAYRYWDWVHWRMVSAERLREWVSMRVRVRDAHDYLDSGGNIVGTRTAKWAVLSGVVWC